MPLTITSLPRSSTLLTPSRHSTTTPLSWDNTHHTAYHIITTISPTTHTRHTPLCRHHGTTPTLPHSHTSHQAPHQIYIHTATPFSCDNTHHTARRHIPSSTTPSLSCHRLTYLHHTSHTLHPSLHVPPAAARNTPLPILCPTHMFKVVSVFVDGTACGESINVL